MIEGHRQAMPTVGAHHNLAVGLGLDAVLQHQATRARLASPNTPGRQRLVHARPAIPAFALRVNGAHGYQSGFIAVAYGGH